MLVPTLALGAAIAVFAVGTAGIAVVGTRLAQVVDRLADRTGIGEALAGAVLLGASTSIAGLLVSAVAAVEGNASLAVSNSVGGIAAQTAFLAVADVTYRRVNLEHAAASLSNLFNCLLMVVLLGIAILGVTGPQLELLAIHPATPLLLAAYGYGIWMSRQVGEDAMWKPAETEQTVVDVPDREAHDESTAGLWLRFALLAAGLGAFGWGVGISGLSIVAETGLSATIVGAFFTSISTSLPELITAIAAARAGAPTLAVAGIVGGNSFDVLFIAVADVLYREGSIYQAVDRSDVFVLGWTVLLIAVAGAGLVRRQREGIGFEGIAILVIYLLGLAALTAI